MGLRRHGHNLNYATVIDVLQVLIMGSIFVIDYNCITQFIE